MTLNICKLPGCGLVIVALVITLSLLCEECHAKGMTLPFQPTLSGRFQVQGNNAGAAGILVGDYDGNGIPELIVPEQRYGSYWYKLEFFNGSYRRLFVSDPIPSFITHFRSVQTTNGTAALVLSQDGSGLFLNPSDLSVIETFSLENADARRYKRIAFSQPSNGDPTLLALMSHGAAFTQKVEILHYPMLDVLWEYESTTTNRTDLALRNLDSDSSLELVFATADGLKILNWDTQTIQFELPVADARLSKFQVGNFDQDPALEIAYLPDFQRLMIIDILTGVVVETNAYDDALTIDIVDYDGDGIDELLLGMKSGSFSNVSVVDATDFVLLFSSSTPSAGPDIARIGDFDQDNQQEILWTSGHETSSYGRMSVVDLQTDVVKWVSYGQGTDYGWYAAADVNADGEQGLILASNFSESGGTGGRLTLIDPETSAVHWESSPVPNGGLLGPLASDSFELIQADEDPQLEIVVITPTIGNLKIEFLDGLSGDWQSSTELQVGGSLPHADWLKVFERAGQKYFLTNAYLTIAGQSDDPRLIMFDETGAQVWSSDQHTSQIVGTWLIDVDQDSDEEILAAFTDGIRVYELSDAAPVMMLATTLKDALVEDYDQDGDIELLTVGAGSTVSVRDIELLQESHNLEFPFEIRAISTCINSCARPYLFATGENKLAFMDPAIEIPNVLADIIGTEAGHQLVIGENQNGFLPVYVGSRQYVERIDLIEDLIFASGFESDSQ